jgi:peptidoglycan/LPS O-acetylase OafA/YrhL
LGILRLWLACVVVDTHYRCIYGYQTIGPESAVRIFFVISGFYMAMVYDGHYASQYLPFIKSRWVRFYPPYILVAFLTVLALTLAAWRWGIYEGPFSLTLGQGLRLQGWSRAMVQGTTLSLAGQEWCEVLRVPLHGAAPYFSIFRTLGTASGTDFQPIPQAWTLGLEETFCLSLPIWLSLRTRSLAILLGLALLTQTILRFTGISYFLALIFPPLGLCAFFGGIIAWRLHAARKSPYGWQHGTLVGLFLAWVLFGDYFGLDEVVKVGISTLATACVLGPLFAWSRLRLWDRWIGNFSYPMYLLHHLVGMPLAAWSLHRGMDLQAWVLPLTLAASVAMWYGMLRPLEAWRRRFRVRQAQD